MNVRMMPPQGPMGQPQPMGGAPAPMPPQGGPMPVPPMQGQPTAGQQKGQGLGSTFGGSAQGRQGFKQFMAAKKQTSAMVPQIPQAQMPMPQAPMGAQPMLPAPSPQMMGAMKPMGAPQMGGPVQAGRPMRGTQGGLGSAPVQLNMGGVVPQLSMDMAADGPAVYLGDQRLSDPADFHQKMLRAGYGRDAILDSASNIRDAAMHIVEDTDEYLGGARSGFNHVHEFNEGGGVPRQTTIAGQPHYLAYINPEEGELLKGLGGAGAPGPGGIPSYWFHNQESRDKISKAVSDFFGGGGNDNTTPMPTNTSVDFTLPPTSADDKPATIVTIDYGDDDDGITNVTYHDDKPSTTTTQPVSTGTLIDLSGANLDLDAFGGPGPDVGIPGIDTSYVQSDYYEPPGFDFDGDGEYGEGSDVVDPGDDDPFVDVTPTPVTPIYDDSDYDYGTGSDETDFTQPVYTPVVDTTPAPAPVYYDMFGGAHSSQAAADAADAKYTAEAVAAEAVETVTSTPETTYSYTGADTDTGGDLDPASMYETNIFREASVPLPSGAGPTSEDIMPGITGTGTGTAAADRTEAEENAIRALYGMDPIGVDADEEDELKTAVEDIYDIGLGGEFGGLDLDVPEAEAEVGLEAALPDYSDDDLGLPDFPVEFPDEGESAEDFRRTEAGLSGIDFDTGQREGGEADEDETKDALMDAVKARVSEVEGTSDEGGYDRLLGGQEDRFGVKPSEMTVAEVLAFQKERGDGSYADYSKDTVGRIATPVGKYQVVGSTLQSLVDRGIVDENEMFDAATQERIGSYLIQSRGLFDENISDEQFVENLGNEFEGIDRFGYDGGTEGVEQRQESIAAVSQKVSDDDLSTIKEQLSEAIDPTLTEMGLALGAELLIPGFGGMIAEQIRTSGPAERQAIIDSHVRALEAGATPLYDDDGNYTGFDRSTMGTFADAVLAADDIGAFLPPSMEGGTFTVTQDDIDSLRESGLGDRADELTVGQELTLPEFTNDSYLADADQDGQLDSERFADVFDAQESAAEADPYGMSTEDGFILTGEDGLAGTEDDREFFVLDDGNVVEIRGDGEGEDKDIVDLDLTPDDVQDVIDDIIGDDTSDLGGDDGTQVSNPCPDGYSLVDGMCQPDDGIGTEEGDEAAARVNLRLRKIDRGGGDLPDATIPDPVEGEALIVRKPAQFEFGGGVYGPDADQGDYDRYYVRDNVVYTDYGPGVSTYQIGEGEDPSAIINFLDQQGFRETAPADSMDDGSAFLGFGGDQTSQGQQGQTSLPVFNPVMPEPKDPTIPDYETPVDPDPIADPLHDPRKMIIRAPKQFETAYDGIVFNPDTDPLKRFMDNSKAVPFSGQKVRKTAQFAQGGMVTPNIDRFLQSLGA